MGFVSEGAFCMVGGMMKMKTKMCRLVHRGGRVLGIVAAAWVLAVAVGRAETLPDSDPLLLGGDEERLLVLAPHPDDEAIGAGGLIQEAVELGIPVKVCFLTMGDNNELAFMFVRKHPVVMPGAVRRMGETRLGEAREAARKLGLDPAKDLVFLGYPDFGTLRIWNDHWRDVTPLRSMLTRATAVPYPEARTPGAAYAGEDVLEDLTEVIREFRPTHVALPSAADHNVDHRALYLFARVALWDLEAEGIAPERLAYPVHYPRWPSPRRLHPDLEAVPPPFLAQSDEIGWQVFSLAPWQVTNKLEAVKAHRSQCMYSAGYLMSFVRTSEWFGDFDDIVLPGGIGQEEVADGDTGAYSQDDEFLGELAKEDPAWHKIAEQQDKESAEVARDDFDFLNRRISADGQSLTLVCRFSRPLPGRAAASLRFYGWRADVPFGQMPKIHVQMVPRKIKAVTDLDRKLDAGEVAIPDGLYGNELGITVPLALLGNPQKLLVSASISRGDMPLDWAAWRAVDLGGAVAPPAADKAAPSRPDPYAAAASARRAPSGSETGPKLVPRVSAARTSAAAAPVQPEPPAPAAPTAAKSKPKPGITEAATRRARTSSAAGSADEAVVW